MVETKTLSKEDWKIAESNAVPIFSHLNVELGISSLLPGERLPAKGFSIHQNNDEYAYILSGEVTFCTEDERYELQEGEFVYNEKGTAHYTENNSNFTARLLWILSPGRKK